MWYIYALHCNDGTLYVGSTNSIKRRWFEHQDGQSRSTRYKRPLRLVWYMAVQYEFQARHLEKYFKVGSGKAILKKRFIMNG
ncbi:MAG: GIY-YIG nuclease family protein [Patescibacteria group bacterium]|jgi:predicted GIY-YIG superfamily endonuclease